MKITSILDIIDGVLVNTPIITFVYDIHTRLEKVNNGDLFISSDINEIKEAIEKGVYCIISDITLEEEYNEIAIIKTDNINKAITKLLRFNFMHKDNMIFHCDVILLEFIRIYKGLLPDNLYILPNNAKDMLSFTQANDIKKSVLFCSNKKLLEAVCPSFSIAPKTTEKVTNLVVHSLFKTSFSYNDIHYSKLNIASCYINNLTTFLNIFTIRIDPDDIPAFSSKLLNFEYLKPIYLNKNNNLSKASSNSKMVITSCEKYVYNYEIDYINKVYPYGKVVVIDKNSPEFIDTILNGEYDLLYVKNAKRGQINELLNNTETLNEEQLTLDIF